MGWQMETKKRTNDPHGSQWDLLIQLHRMRIYVGLGCILSMRCVKSDNQICSTSFEKKVILPNNCKSGFLCDMKCFCF